MTKVKAIKSMSILEMAKAELKTERATKAKEKLKHLFSQQNSAKKVLKNIEREIEDYLNELEVEDEDLNS